MERYLLRKIVIIVLVVLFHLFSFAQEGDKNVKQKIVDEHGNVSLITFHERSTYRNSDFQKVFKEQFALKEESEFRKIKSELDQSGFLHEKYQLFHKGIKVEFVTYSLHSKEGKLISMNGELYALDNINTTPQFSKEQASSYALRQIGAKEYLWENPDDAAIFNYKKPEGELVLLPVYDDENNGQGHLKLAYKFDVYATNPVSRGDIYIDAINGNTLFYNATIKHLGEFGYGKSREDSESILFKKSTALLTANADTRYSGSQSIETTLNGSYILADATRSSGINTYNLKKSTNYSSAVNFTDADNNWTAAEYHNVNKDDGALDAHWGAEKTYDYWLSVHGRSSYNNAGGAINSYVHYSNAYNNAYWNGSVMTYGDGSGSPNGFDILTSIDVCAHEIGHGVCSNTANLAYQKESGALNEGLSDIWGACVEYFAAPNDPNKQTWLIGEQIDMRTGHAALRSMSNPNLEGQPDTYGGTYWVNQKCIPNSNNDYCGVHTNSGVLNHWFYILTIGESGTNDIGKSYNVAGIGIDKAAKITFRMESAYMTANTTYANARTYAIQSATDLYGVNSPEVIATTDAFYAVGVGAAYAGSGDNQVPTAPTNLIASGTTQTITNLAWIASSDNVGVTGYNIYQNGVQIGTAINNSYSVTGLAPATTYLFTVKAKDATGNLSLVSNTATVTTLVNTITYCSSQGNNATNNRIGKVVFNTISNPSTSTAGYEDFTALSTTVARGKSYTVTIFPTRTSTTSKEGYAVFIDYNGDGDFADTGERVWTKSATNASSVSGTFTIRTDAVVGTTRMRVSMKYNSVPTSCEIFANGQVEDYTVVVAVTAPLEPTNITDTVNESLSVMLYPDPVENYLSVSLSSKKDTSYSIINQIGQEVKRGKLVGDGIDVNELSSGLYFLRLNDNRETVTKRFIKR